MAASRDAVFDELLSYLSEPLFLIPVNSFMDEHCLIFDAECSVVGEHKEIHESYKNMIDALLVAFSIEYNLPKEDIMREIKKFEKISDLHIMFGTSFQHICAADDFDLFYTLMAKRNIVIQEQVLAMILSVRGALPESLKRGNSEVTKEKLFLSDASGNRFEEAVMEDVLRNSQGSVGHNEVPVLSIDIRELEENQKVLNEKMKKLILKEKQLQGEFHSKEDSIENVEPIKSSQGEGEPHLENKLSQEELKERQDFLRKQRDKLLNMKKEAREKQLKDIELPVINEPKVVIAHQKSNEKDDKMLALRRTIAEKLRQEVIEKN